MKKTIFMLLTLVIVYKQDVSAQVETKADVTYWGGVPFDRVMRNSELIFEGRILTDSVYFQNPPGEIYTWHRVLVLKEFKGVFKSDTINVDNLEGVMSLDGVFQGSPPYARKGDEAVFFVSSSVKYGKNDPNYFYLLFGDGCGFVRVCDKKDVIKEVYEPIETATKTQRVVLRKNSCER